MTTLTKRNRVGFTQFAVTAFYTDSFMPKCHSLMRALFHAFHESRVFNPINH